MSCNKEYQNFLNNIFSKKSFGHVKKDLFDSSSEDTHSSKYLIQKIFYDKNFKAGNPSLFLNSNFSEDFFSDKNYFDNDSFRVKNGTFQQNKFFNTIGAKKNVDFIKEEPFFENLLENDKNVGAINKHFSKNKNFKSFIFDSLQKQKQIDLESAASLLTAYSPISTIEILNSFFKENLSLFSVSKKEEKNNLFF